ncbi:hypothetical protein AAY86_15085 [Pseudomonas amygdali pv. tabaci str. ATCC 11528]|nr:hypothetical protein C1E_0208270 [Pseudomonas amygdali pv. tabaci str. ATCC 11528]KKY51701.1 hypothetical protein AAY86_15085 [Pseudomonas amygdali pv. tabaci str. ATCC 11528]QED87610.1 hypothetical protein PSYTB_25005 [Pseudomonas amygdali pv. tabaci str. ATCC 11528]
MIDGPIENDISLSAPHKLFNTIYANSHPDKISLYEASESIFQRISVEAMTIDENIKLHMELTETRNASDIDGDAIRLFIITRAICKTFDILHVDLFPVPYFMIKSSKDMIQVCVACEADLKQWLRKYIILIESFSGSVWPEQKIYLFNIRRYLFIGANFFRCFESGSIIQKYDSLNWEGTTNVFKN